MIRLPRVPRARRSTIVLVFAVAALAFPLGVWANHQFDDVPTGASFHDDVEALVAHGITSGCQTDPPLYCPSNPVTRAQMAQFMNRLGSLDGSTPPSVDADMVDGYQADELSGAALGSTTAAVLTAAYQSIGSVTVEAPVAGYVVVNASTTVYSFDAGCPCEVHAGLSTSTSPIVPDSWSNARVGIDAGSTDIAVIAVPHVFEVDAGTHTFHLIALNFNAASGTANATFGRLVAQFTPFASAGDTLSFDADVPASMDNRLSD